MPDQLSAMLESFKTFWNQLIMFLPKLAIGIGLLVIGWLIAKLLRIIIIWFLKLVRLDVAAEKSGIQDFLLKGGARYSTVTILANIFYWFIMLALTLAVLNSLGLNAAAELFNRIILYVPNIIIAVLVLVFGSLFAKFIRGSTHTYLSNIGISGAELISNATYGAILFLVVFVALQQLSLGSEILISAFIIAFGGLCLALAIAFGLAGKEWATQILEKFWRNSR